VVVVHVEDRDLFTALIKECLGCDGRVVEVAITAHQVAGGVMPRWAAQGEGTVGALRDGGLRRKGHLRRTVSRLPSACGDWRATVETVIAQLAVQAGGQHAAQRARRPGVGQQVAVLAVFGPALPGVFEEVEVVAAVDTLQRRQAEILRRLHRPQLPLFDALQYMVGARGHFEAGHQLPVHQLTTAMVQMMIVRVDRQHVVVLQRLRGMPCSVARRRGLENGRSGQKGIDMANVFVRYSPLARA